MFKIFYFWFGFLFVMCKFSLEFCCKLCLCIHTQLFARLLPLCTFFRRWQKASNPWKSSRTWFLWMFDFDNSCSTCDFGDKQPHAFGFSIAFPYDVEQLYIVIFALLFIFVYIGHPCFWDRHLSTTFSGASKPLFLRPSVRGCQICSPLALAKCRSNSR